MESKDMRSVVLAASSEEQLIEALGKISGYTLIQDPARTYHPFTLVNKDGCEINIHHSSGTTHAMTTNISSQDHDDAPVPFTEDEATKLCDAAKEQNLLAVLSISDNDKEKLKK
ncbi:hypothetical protein [Acetobacter ascendens]|uniref:hypothetical protein n=1 Tax=Acetobacter ascendens TaxID=481146 RepID=UPI0012FF67C6|nr:hypothetical protein [Acetobacter ascendens]